MNCIRGVVIVFLLCFGFQNFFAQDTTSLDLLPVEIRAERSFTPSKIALNRSHFLSSPASFDDPSRLLMKYPGFSVSNDQNNAIIYEGLPSHYSTWSLYGAQISNPNHLSNAGTANDRPSRSAGGVNMFSGQVIGGLDYHTGVEGPTHGVGGVADISIRSPYQNSVTANLSLIGLEAGIDRIFDDGNSSLLANYRYSTVGLLGQMGVDFGGDMITYQDVLTEYKTKWKGQEISFTAAYGQSSNNFEKQFDQGDSLATFKEIQDIELEAINLATAISISGDNHRITLAYSLRDETRASEYFWNEEIENTSSLMQENIFSLYAYKSWKNENFDFDISLNANQFSYDIFDFSSRYFDDNLDDYTKSIFFDETYLEFRPRATVTWKFNHNHDLSIGSGGYIQSFNNETHLLPFIRYRGKYKALNTSFTIQNDRQSAAPELLGMSGYDGITSFSNSTLQSINAWSFKLDLNKEHYGFMAFTNLLYDIPFGPSSRLSGLSELGQLPITPLGSIEDAVTVGTKVYSKFDVFGYRVNLNYTFMESLLDDRSKTSIPLDFTAMFNFKLDKTYKFSDSKSLRVATSFHFRNGYRRMFIDEEESRRRLQTIYSSYEFSRLNNYHRLDLRLSYIKKGKWKNVISLDIQNVMNRQNEAFYYYDPLLDEAVLQNQLGLIPILSWRVVI